LIWFLFRCNNRSYNYSHCYHHPSCCVTVGRDNGCCRCSSTDPRHDRRDTYSNLDCNIRRYKMFHSPRRHRYTFESCYHCIDKYPADRCYKLPLLKMGSHKNLDSHTGNFVRSRYRSSGASAHRCRYWEWYTSSRYDSSSFRHKNTGSNLLHGNHLNS